MPLLETVQSDTQESVLSTLSACRGIPGSLWCVHVEGPAVIDPDWASQEEIPACH